jgi:acyl-CoA thioester hydrolase
MLTIDFLFHKKGTFLNIINLKENTTNVRVRYGETDQMGVVYYGNYAQYLEQGRTEWLRELGFSYKWMEDNNIILPVVNLNIDYKKSARYDDIISITTTLKKIPTIKIEFDYKIHNEKGELLVTASTTLVFVNKSTNKLTKAPDYLLEKLL